VSVSETLEGVSPSTKGSPKDNCDKSSTKVSANNKRVHPSTKRVSSPQKAPVAQNQNASMTSRNNSIGRGPSMTSNQNKNLNTSSSTQSADKQTSKKKGYRRNGRNFDRNVNDRGSAQNSSNITVDQQTPEKGVASQVGITVAAH
jgi:GH24 family phage-related lysozyme (muramidase)